MTRLNDLQAAVLSGNEVRWDPRSVDVMTAVQTARRMRAQYTAELLSRGFTAGARLSGLTALCAAILRGHQRRRTEHELSDLSNRVLADIGLERSLIPATAVRSTAPSAEHRSVWHMLAGWAKRAHLRRKTVRQLSEMPDRMLRDIGVERADIRRIATALAAGQYEPQEATDPSAALPEGVRIPETMALLSINPGTIGRNSSGQPRPANENLGHSSAA